MSSGDGLEAGPEASVNDLPIVAASHTSPDRTVFTEQGNTEAWIATDLTVDLER
ncbi:hypothetical protein [Halorubrum sp. JWXQ-INN 858]|uniref:hypothetical protein n=1 Tax=Halorubrum sp. JWXQ-INN 858 TaxID=2690782 RepID=UPI00190F1A58|nr:hypothetical protein [Halorubrum sp. JWXQ-INN 858]